MLCSMYWSYSSLIQQIGNILIFKRNINQHTKTQKNRFKNLVRQKDILQLGLGSIFQEFQPFFYVYLAVTHVVIPPLRIFIFCQMASIIFIAK